MPTLWPKFNWKKFLGTLPTKAKSHNPFSLGDSYSKLEFLTIKSEFLSFFKVGFIKKMPKYYDPIAEKLELIFSAKSFSLLPKKIG